MNLPIQCATCSNYEGGLKCPAFPNKIPVEIITGDFDHSKPFPGDNGIRWEKLEGLK